MALKNSPSPGGGGWPPLSTARLVAAHDAHDMAAYRIALDGYTEGAGKAYRKTKGVRRKRKEG